MLFSCIVHVMFWGEIFIFFTDDLETAQAENEFLSSMGSSMESVPKRCSTKEKNAEIVDLTKLMRYSPVNGYITAETHHFFEKKSPEMAFCSAAMLNASGSILWINHPEFCLSTSGYGPWNHGPREDFPSVALSIPCGVWWEWAPNKWDGSIVYWSKLL